MNNTVPTCCVKVDVHYCRASTSIPWSYSYIYAAVISPVISSVCSWGDCCSIFKTLRLDLLSGINWLKAAVGRAMQSNKSSEGLRNELIKVTHIKCLSLQFLIKQHKNNGFSDVRAKSEGVRDCVGS